MARGLMRALTAGGHDVRLVSRLRSRASEPSPATLARQSAEGADEAKRLLDAWTGDASAWRPELWWTYHLYYKAPDWLGPAISRELAIPYVIAEASYAAKRDNGPWAPWQTAAVAAIHRADVNVCLTERDRAGLLQLGLPEARLAQLPPFIDMETAVTASNRSPRSVPSLITVAMMRPGVKTDSYRLLAAALALITDLPRQLTIVGDGPTRADVATAFAGFDGHRISWTGALDAAAVSAALANADLFVWPGLGEAFGVAYLEAQAHGLPVVAMQTGGVASVVRDGVTGILTPEGDIAAYAAAIRHYLTEPALLAAASTAAKRFVVEERAIAPTAARLNAILEAIRSQRT